MLLDELALKALACLAQFEECLRRELAAAQADEAGFVADFSQRDYEDVVEGWQAKLQRVKAGEQRWGMFMATKPAGSHHAANGTNGTVPNGVYMNGKA